VEILDDSGRPEMSFPITRCPVCGDPIVPLEQCKTFEDVVKREG
jgi:hypothetical protein